MHIENDYLILPNYFKRKKITATNFYGLIGGNKFKPKGDYLLSNLGLLKEEIDPFYTKRGEIAERICNEYLKQKGYITKTWNKNEINYDNFPKLKEVGGMIDIAITHPFRCVVECKSKNRCDIAKIKLFPNLEQENQALFYAFLSKCEKVKIIYVFFTDEQEDNIRKNIRINEDISNFCFYEKDLSYTNEDISNKIQQAIDYKNKCIFERAIPLCDISDKALKLLNLSRS